MTSRFQKQKIPLIIKVNNTIVGTAITNECGKYSYNYTTIIKGLQNATVTYEGNQTYKPTENETQFGVKGKDTCLTVNTTSPVIIGNNTTIKGVLTDYDEPVSNAPITIIINDDMIINTQTDDNGEYTVDIPITTPGINNISVKFNGDNEHNPSQADVKVYAKQLQTITLLDPIEPTKINETITLNAKVIDENGDPIKEGNVDFYINGQLISTEKVNKGISTIEISKDKQGIYPVEAIYTGTEKYTTSSDETKALVKKLDTTITVDDKIAPIGDDVELVAHVIDENGNPVNGGNVIFKLNGITITDDIGNSIKISVNKGLAKLTINVPLNWRNIHKNITSVYTGTQSVYNSARSDNADLTIILRTVKVSVNTNPTSVKMDDILTITAKVSDNNRIVNGKIIFKINGVTLKDEYNDPLKVELKDNTASINYIIPDGWAEGKMNTTAVIISEDYYRAEATTQFNVIKTDAHFVIDEIYTSSRYAKLKGVILDEHNHKTVGPSKIAIKIDGKTLRIPNGEVQYFMVNNGMINIDFVIPVEYKTGKHKIEVVTGATYAYNSARATTNLTLEV